jgi:hypothetical protein
MLFEAENALQGSDHGESLQITNFDGQYRICKREGSRKTLRMAGRSCVPSCSPVLQGLAVRTWKCLMDFCLFCFVIQASLPNPRYVQHLFVSREWLEEQVSSTPRYIICASERCSTRYASAPRTHMLYSRMPILCSYLLR